MLDEEERDDTALKERFGAKWKRSASSGLTDSIRSEVTKFQGIVQSATKVYDILGSPSLLLSLLIG